MLRSMPLVPCDEGLSIGGTFTALVPGTFPGIPTSAHLAVLARTVPMLGWRSCPELQVYLGMVRRPRPVLSKSYHGLVREMPK